MLDHRLPRLLPSLGLLRDALLPVGERVGRLWPGWYRILLTPSEESFLQFGQLLSTCRTKADWYEAMNMLGIENAPQLDAEDSIRFWASKLGSIGHPAAKFFAGDSHAEDNGADDPNAGSVSGELASAFLSQLEQLGEAFFINLFPHKGPYGVGHAWLYEPLCVFLREARLQGNAVMILWED